jgi:esterase/lipase superfamily enzyme
MRLGGGLLPRRQRRGDRLTAELEREYLKDWSSALEREMEILRFGSSGLPMLVFPTSMGRFYQWEDFGLVGAVADRIDAGNLQLWCVDSVDGESWYASGRPAAERVPRHLLYERYLMEEVVPRLPAPPVTTGTSFGAFHAVLLCLRFPERFRGWIALSGVYDTSRWLNGHNDDLTYLTNPLAFLPGLNDERYLGPLREMDFKVIATGSEDPNLRDCLALAEDLREKQVQPRLDVWPGWQHDWPYWKEMMRTYV